MRPFPLPIRTVVSGCPTDKPADHPQVDEGLGVADAFNPPQFFRQELEQRGVVLADHLDEHVVGSRRDDHVVDLGKRADGLGHAHQPVSLAADADHCHLLEAELERVCHADDLQDPPLDQSVGTSPDSSLAHTQLERDLGEGPPTVLLQVLDDPLVELRDVIAPAPAPPRPRHRHLVPSRDSHPGVVPRLVSRDGSVGAAARAARC